MRRVRRLAVAPVLALALVASLAACQPVRASDKTLPIVMVHGYNFSPAEVDCGGAFDTMISQLKAKGFTGPFIKVGYYAADKNCDVNLHSFGSFDDRDSWKDIAKAFSNYVQTTYTSKGKAIDAVGYSMGALVVRGAIYGSQSRTSGFAAPIDVQDYVSLGGPHAGAASYTTLCLWGQCHSMAPSSGDIDWLNTNLNPQGKNGTESTVIGSSADTTVPAVSALYMGLPTSRKVQFSDIPHSGSNNYTHNAGVITRAALALSDVNQ